MQSQGSSTPQEFYERCQNLYGTIITYVTLHENVDTTIEAKRTLYKKFDLTGISTRFEGPVRV